jgi:hypothetical protein
MSQTYRLVGSQDPSSRIDRVTVESPSEEHPDGKTLELNGPAVELSAEQVAKISPYARLEPVSASDPEVPPVVDQPGVNRPSQSTDVPPDLGTTPDLGSLNQEELYAEVERVRARDAGAVPDVNARSSKQDLRNALNDHYAQGKN